MDKYSDNLARHVSWPQTPRAATPLSELDDQALIAAISARDGNALATLYDRYAGVLYRMALRMLKNPELAEEVVQEVFWRVWRRSASFEQARGRVAQWLFGIGHNLCIDELRRIRARPAQVHEDDGHTFLQQVADERTDVPTTVWAAEQRRIIAEAMHQLPQTQRQAIELAYFSGLSHQEIASRLDRPLGTIKTRVRLGLHKLGGLLAARGLLPSDA